MSASSGTLVRSLSHLLAALISNPSKFRRQWKQCQSGSDPSGILGRWQGHWASQTSGHGGRLKCVLTRAETSGHDYEAYFFAVFARVLSVCYAVRLHGRQTDSGVHLEGETDIGRLAGGVYSYKGEVTPSGFRCAYRGSYDHGIFEMKKVLPPEL